MANVLVKPATLQGPIAGIPSKSDFHRLAICAALADAPTTLQFAGKARLSADMQATLACLRALGASVAVTEDAVTVTPIVESKNVEPLSCGESGSTLRFLIPVACALADHCCFTGSGKLPQRPLNELLEVLGQNGVSFSFGEDAFLPLLSFGLLQAGKFTLPGNVSSQYITGLLMALPLLSGDSSIVLTTELQSAAYVDITIDTLSKFGITVIPTDSGWNVPGRQVFHSPGRVMVDTDWSNAAFWMVAGVSVTGLSEDSPQGDKRIAPLLSDWASVSSVDLRQIPDMLPALAIATLNGTHPVDFTHGERLRMKESDRIQSVYDMVTALGGTATITSDGLHIEPGVAFSCAPLRVNSYNDHRIAMAAAIGATLFGPPEGVLIEDAAAVEKSYPDFFSHLTQLGGQVYEF